MKDPYRGKPISTRFIGSFQPNSNPHSEYFYRGGGGVKSKAKGRNCWQLKRFGKIGGAMKNNLVLLFPYAVSRCIREVV